MMTVPMDSSSSPSSQEIAQRLFKKNIELENGLRKAAQAKIPSNPNVWLQMRENYEVIVLEDHEFSERHDVEYKLWQLHYKRIEEFRVHIYAAKSSGSAVVQGVQSQARPDHVKKIWSAFKSFLSEATGFYHDLMHKIRAKYSLPLGYVPESHVMLTKGEKKLAEIKKGLISCHRCLIYLGDLARYKGMYGEGESINHDFTAASSYYLQAASLNPSSGNPHHQLAILASYSSDEQVTIYRYFRSLAVDNPFSTARDNLIIAFEKNRQRAAQLTSAKSASANALPPRSTGRGRGRGRVDARFLAKNRNVDSIKDQELSMPEIFNAFSTRFVRLLGILFTRTSLETFEDVLSSVISDLLTLLSTGPIEAFNFGAHAADNGLVVVRLVSILVFMVHEVNRDSSGKSFSETLQRSVLLENVFTALFLLFGHIFKRCSALSDVASSYLLPGIMVFIEWLACHLDIAVGFDVLQEKEASARSFFWYECIGFMNALLLCGHGYIDPNEEDSCFSDMNLYDEEETGNRLALWEDFELRGFLPLLQAHLILDFSRKRSLCGSGTNKEKRIRVQRIFAAGKALMNVVRIDEKGIFFDRDLKKFVCGVEPPSFEGEVLGTFTDVPDSNGPKYANSVESMSMTNLVGSQSNIVGFGFDHLDGEDDEEEEIVFKPIVSVSKGETLQLMHASAQNVTKLVTTSLEASPQPWRNLNYTTSNGLKNAHIDEGFGSGNTLLNKVSLADVIIPSPLDSVMPTGAMTSSLPVSASTVLPNMSKKAPVSRPTRHFGPPPGFAHLTTPQDNSLLGSATIDDQPHIDDYSWLDDYKPPSSVKNPSMSFPFPGKQVPSLQTNVMDDWQEFKLFDELKPYAEQNVAQENLRRAVLPPEKHRAPSLWSVHYFV